MEEIFIVVGDGERGALGNKLLTSTSRASLIASKKPTRKFNDKDLLRGKVAAGLDHSCAVNQDRRVYCWGNGDDGRLGGNSTSDSQTPDLVHGTVNGFGLLGGVYQVDNGYKHTCAVKTNGRAYCWGDGEHGRLGNDSTSGSHFPVAVAAGETDTTGDLTGVRQVSSGGFHTCALKSNQQVVCWGYNDDGQLGNKSNANSSSPVLVHTSSSDTTPLSDIIQISSGGRHTCALKSSGKVYCWGEGDSGRLGVTASEKTTPVQVPDVSGIVQISLGISHTCVLKYNGQVHCWGGSLYSKLGGSNKNTPVKKADLTTLFGVEKLAIADRHSCAMQTSGRIYCWGSKAYGRLGDGVGNENSTSQSQRALLVKGIGNNGNMSEAIDINSFDDHTCALRKDGLVACWGKGDSYQLGNNSASHKNTPVLAVRTDKDAGVFSTADISPNQQISTSYDYACAVKNDGTPLCWGKAGSRLGQSSSGNDQPVPGVVSSLVGCNKADQYWI